MKVKNYAIKLKIKKYGKRKRCSRVIRENEMQPKAFAIPILIMIASA